LANNNKVRLQTDHASDVLVDPAKTFLTSSFITMQNSVIVTHTVYTHVGGPKILGLGIRA